MTSIFLSLGSNLGDRYRYLLSARHMIENRVGNITAVSSVYESEPWGYTSTNWFYNQVLRVETDMNAFHLLSLLQQMEKESGRESHSPQYLDRTLDIDILFYGNAVIDTPGLTIPHRHIAHRRFILEPLCEVAPEYIHPVLQLSIRHLLHACTDNLPVRKLNLQL